MQHFVRINFSAKGHRMFSWLETDNIKINYVVDQMVINAVEKKRAGL